MTKRRLTRALFSETQYTMKLFNIMS